MAAMVAVGLWMAQAPAVEAQALVAELRAQYDSAYFAWDRGDYPRALTHAERILSHPGGEALLDRVALLTGELYRVHEVASDGRQVVWSPDGSHFAYESGAGAEARLNVMAVTAAGVSEVATLAGWEASFAPDGRSMAYLRLPQSEALVAAAADERRALAAGDGAGVRSARQRIAQLGVAGGEIVVRSLADGSEEVRAAPGLERHRLTHAGDGTPLLVGRAAGQNDRFDLFLLPPGGQPRRLTDGPGARGARLIPVGTNRLVYTIGNDQVAVHDLTTGEIRTLSGRSPTVSRDGSTLAYLSITPPAQGDLRRGEALTGADLRSGGNVTSIMVLPLAGTGEPRVVRRTDLPVADPALSPSGARLAFSMMPRDDWEIFVIGTDGSAEVRVTNDPQHDLLPHFLAEGRLLGLMGESRHRRSYLYDLDTDPLAEIAARTLPGDDQRGRTRLFHNNTLRTVAPQYEWVPDQDGTRILIVADRDGDTISPERGLYLIDLNRRVTREEVLDRVRRQLAAETELRERAAGMFAGIDAEVRATVAEVEVGRIYDHAHALYQFGSKYFTRPGNAHAIEYLANSLGAMGYSVELQWFEPRPGFRSANVVATLRGTVHPDRINVISSHFDSVDRSPGADDNSSGTTALLEAARVLAGRPQPETIRFAFLTAEEAGLLGAREFVRRAAAANDGLVAVLNNDMVGWTRSHRLDSTIRYSSPVVRDIQHGAAIRYSDLITYDARYVLSTDAQVFWESYGDILGGMGGYPILSNPHYHQPHDRLEFLDHRLVAEVTRATVAAIMLLSNGIDPGSGT